MNILVKKVSTNIDNIIEIIKLSNSKRIKTLRYYIY